MASPSARQPTRHRRRRPTSPTDAAGPSGLPSGAGGAGWESRLAAADLISLVADGGADLETAMDRSADFRALEGSDRGFARAIAGAALRGQGRIDHALGGLLERPLDAMEPAVRALLRAGCAQLWLMDVPHHAAVSATVEAARQWRPARRGGGLVNAVLRRASREGEAFASAPATSVWPDWLAAKLKAALGVARAEALARMQLREPAIDLSLMLGESPQAWADRLGGEELANGSVRLAAGVKLTELPGYLDGKWWVQDAAATIAAKLLGDVADKAVADLCAAPGGKSLQLAAAGARLWAVDLSRQRLERLRENRARIKLEMQIVEGDARSWRPPEKLAAVLLDAPCSALGVLRRHPEGAWRRDAHDLMRFPTIQRALLDAARDMLKPGGRLVYCVCTPAAEEGRDVVAGALADGGWKRVTISPDELPGFAHALTDDGDVMTAPQAALLPTPGERDMADSGLGEIVAEPVESDVFYVARLERTGD